MNIQTKHCLTQTNDVIRHSKKFRFTLSFGRAPYKIGEEIRGRLLKISYALPKRNWSKGTYSTLPQQTSSTIAVACCATAFCIAPRAILLFVLQV